MNVKPEVARFSLEHTVAGVRVNVPARKNIFVLLFVCVWLAGWVFGEYSVIKQLLAPSENSADAFLFVWLIGWTLGGIWAVSTVLWMLFGRELVSVESGLLLHRFEILGLGRTRKFDGQLIRHLRVVDYAPNLTTQQKAYMLPIFAGDGLGPLAFDYGAKSIRLGASFEEAEARSFISELYGRLPSGVKNTPTQGY